MSLLAQAKWTVGTVSMACLLMTPVLGLAAEVVGPGATARVPGQLGVISKAQFKPERGFYFAPIDVHVAADTIGATLVYTTDGSEPSLTHGIKAGSNVTVRLTTTTVLRAAAFKDGEHATNNETHTYLFPATVASQRRPATIKPSWPGGYPADFEMDGRVGSTNARPGYHLTNALLELPSVSIVMPPDDLWSAARGIYANSLVGTERAASVEILFPKGQTALQENAGVSLRGFSSGKKSLTPKHSFTVVFRKRYGVSKLEGAIFPGTAVKRFNALVLRANTVDSWANSEVDWNHAIDGEMRWYRGRASYVRDQWMRDTQHAQGQPAGHGRFVHVYLNGWYWGLYNLIERLDEKFAHEHLGGPAKDYDVIADSETKAGNLESWKQLETLAKADLSIDAHYQRLMGNHPDGSRNPSYPVLLDVTNLVDYMILHVYAGADDWPWHNWVAMRLRGVDSSGFKFLAWDQELSINSLVKRHTDTGQRYADVNAAHTYIYARCRSNAEFRQLFADRVQRHLFNDGALSVSNNIARYQTRATEIDRAIVAESARWGDFYRPAQPYLREVEWLGTNRWMCEVFFPSNHFLALKRFRDAKLFPSLAAPIFSPFGGSVPAGFSLTITNPTTNATVYFTTTGADPRQKGGGVEPSAQSYSAPIPIKAPTLIRARVLSDNKWSALAEAMFHPPR